MTRNPLLGELGRWAGVCLTCGTDHDGHPPGTLGAEIRCLRTMSEALGVPDLVDQLDTLERTLADQRQAVLDQHFAGGPNPDPTGAP